MPVYGLDLLEPLVLRWLLEALEKRINGTVRDKFPVLNVRESRKSVHNDNGGMLPCSQMRAVRPARAGRRSGTNYYAKQACWIS